MQIIFIVLILTSIDCAELGKPHGQCFSRFCFAWDGSKVEKQSLKPCRQYYIPLEIHDEETNKELQRFLSNLEEEMEETAMDSNRVYLNMRCSRRSKQCYWKSSNQKVIFENWKGGLSKHLQRWEDGSTVVYMREGKWTTSNIRDLELMMVCMIEKRKSKSRNEDNKENEIAVFERPNGVNMMSKIPFRSTAIVLDELPMVPPPIKFQGTKLKHKLQRTTPLEEETESETTESSIDGEISTKSTVSDTSRTTETSDMQSRLRHHHHHPSTDASFLRPFPAPHASSFSSRHESTKSEPLNVPTSQTDMILMDILVESTIETWTNPVLIKNPEGAVEEVPSSGTWATGSLIKSMFGLKSDHSGFLDFLLSNIVVLNLLVLLVALSICVKYKTAATEGESEETGT